MIKKDFTPLFKGNSNGNNISFFKLILFPKHEHSPLKRRLKNGKNIYTIRVEEEYNKYKINDILETEWEDLVTVVSVEKITDISQYKFYDKIDDETRDFLSKYDKLDVVELSIVNDIYIIILNKLRKLILSISDKA